MSVTADAKELQSHITRLRHELHQEPEIGLHLPRTQEKVLKALDGLPYEITLGETTTSVTAVLRGGAPHTSADKPVVLLRADMDGLPVQERTGVDFTSRIDGAMHACGHDLHTSMLAGAATLLAERRGQLAGDVVLMFQPGEEGHDGAGHMIREGVLDAAGRRADAAYGMHVFSSLEPHGQFATKPGVMLSASDGLFVTVLGAGGHGSAPHTAKDPVTAAAEMVTALQVMITRQFNMFDPVVLTVGVLQAGTARNVIPESARIEATVRTFSHASRERMMTAVPTLLKGIAHAHGLEVDVEYRTRISAEHHGRKRDPHRGKNHPGPVRRVQADALGHAAQRIRGLLPGDGRGARHLHRPQRRRPGSGPHRHRVQPLPLRHVRRRRPHRRCGAVRGARHCPDRSTGGRHPLVPRFIALDLSETS